MNNSEVPPVEGSRVRLRVGGRVFAADPYWPHMGRPVQKERIIEDAEAVGELFAGHLQGPFWTWLDPSNERRRWCRITDAERLALGGSQAKGSK